MKRFFSLFLVGIFITLLPLSVTAAESVSIPDMALELEKKYGISIEYTSAISGDTIVTKNSLTTLDMALENVTANVVRQVSKYYQQKNGTLLTVRYVENTSNLTSTEAILAGFDRNRSLIELYVPSSAVSIIATGENPISIVHEFGHALHLMYCDYYGMENMRQEWKSYNGNQTYQALHIVDNPNERVFVSGYAATMFEEDVAETIAHVFVRNRAGQGFKNRLSQNGNSTGLGRKVAYVENMLSAYLTNTENAVANFHKIYKTPTAIVYQNLNFSGEYLQFTGYPQPRFVLDGTLSSMGVSRTDALWLRSIGGWYVETDLGIEIIVFPGGVWCDAGNDFQRPAQAA